MYFYNCTLLPTYQPYTILHTFLQDKHMTVLKEVAYKIGVVSDCATNKAFANLLKMLTLLLFSDHVQCVCNQYSFSSKGISAPIYWC
jgi:hypothetical protein